MKSRSTSAEAREAYQTSVAMLVEVCKHEGGGSAADAHEEAGIFLFTSLVQPQQLHQLLARG